jgi:hypothetical protein
MDHLIVITAAIDDKLSTLVALFSQQQGGAHAAVKPEIIGAQSERTSTPDLTVLDSLSLVTVDFSPVTELSGSPAGQSPEPLMQFPVELQDPGLVRPEFPPAAAILSPIFQRGAGARVSANDLKRSQRLAAKPMKRWDLAEVGSGTEQRAGRRRVFDPGRLDYKHVRGGSL